MPRYRFNLLNDIAYTVDEEGIDLPDLAAMRAHATGMIGNLVRDELQRGDTSIHLAVMVDDEDGTRIANFRSVTTLVVSSNPFAEL